MLGASLYITFCSAKNRIRVRLRRLREPRYLVGAIVGAAYLYFTIFARGFRFSGSRRRPGRTSSEMPVVLTTFAATGPAFAGIALMVMMALAWLFPADSGLLEFTEAETQFLFPAPVSRRQLLLHRLMRSQFGLLFAAIVPAMIFPSGSPANRLRVAVALWVVFVTIKLHFTGITLARARLAMRGAGRRWQWGVPVVMLGGIAIVGSAIARTVRAPGVGFDDLVRRLADAVNHGLPRVILWPFAALARPLFAAWPWPYLASLVAAFGVLLVNVVWVLWSDEAFQEATAWAEARRAAKKSRATAAPRARATSWTLPLSGRPEMLFVWKNGMQMLRETNIATFLRYGAPFIALATAGSAGLLSSSRMPGAAALVGALAAGAAGMTIFLGPQIARSDLRQDLLHLELLKTWPIRASEVIRGEMLYPGGLLTLVAWFATACAIVMWSPLLTISERVSAGLTAAILTPAIIFAQLTIQNGAAVLFPAWVPLGSSRPRGLDAMGQRLILFAGNLLGLLLMVAPGAIAGGIIWFAFHRLAGPLVFPPAAAVCTAVVAIEVLLATEALGPVYEKLDLSGIERAE